jgi:hypothetical protein
LRTGPQVKSPGVRSRGVVEPTNKKVSAVTFSVTSWNVEHFGSERNGESSAQVQTRINDVFALLDTPDVRSDVFAIYEVEGALIFDQVKQRFPDYIWTITEGAGTQEILVGTKVQAFVTHRPEFSRGFTGALRPGLLVTVTDGGADFPILFLHLKAADEPLDLGVRVFQHDKARSLRKALGKSTADNKPANFIVAGDLNDVGMNLTFSTWDVSLDDEKSRIKAMYESQFDRMRMLPKSAPATFWNGPGSTDDPSDIDHVLAASQISFDQDPSGAEVEVLGWPEEPTDAAKQAWITRYSDHALIRFTVTGVN